MAGEAQIMYQKSSQHGETGVGEWWLPAVAEIRYYCRSSAATDENVTFDAMSLKASSISDLKKKKTSSRVYVLDIK